MTPARQRERTMGIQNTKTLFRHEVNGQEVLDDYGFELALSRLTKELSERTQMQIDYQFIASPNWSGRRLPAATEVGLYRVAVEALNNAISHASASRLCVIVLLQSSKLILLIEDNGCGFDYPSMRKNINACMGIIAMEERVSSLGGTLTLISKPDEGTLVRVAIDWAGNGHNQALG